jgi:hypothetical protein
MFRLATTPHIYMNFLEISLSSIDATPLQLPSLFSFFILKTPKYKL